MREFLRIFWLADIESAGPGGSRFRDISGPPYQQRSHADIQPADFPRKRECRRVIEFQ
jgi:hypothetical protein